MQTVEGNFELLVDVESAKYMCFLDRFRAATTRIAMLHSGCSADCQSGTVQGAAMFTRYAETQPQ